MQEQPERAVERFRQVLTLEPGHREARENLAGMLAATGRLEEAVALYREAIAASPRMPAFTSSWRRPGSQWAETRRRGQSSRPPCK
jgi:Flp pilus assembly protein TadD